MAYLRRSFRCSKFADKDLSTAEQWELGASSMVGLARDPPPASLDQSITSWFWELLIF